MITPTTFGAYLESRGIDTTHVDRPDLLSFTVDAAPNDKPRFGIPDGSACQPSTWILGANRVEPLRSNPSRWYTLNSGMCCYREGDALRVAVVG